MNFVDALINEFEENNIFWQYPVITEKVFFQQNHRDPHYLPVPWATLIDQYKQGETICFDKLKNIIKKYFPDDRSYYTACQHIHFRKIKKLAIELGVKIIYASHKILSENTLGDIEIRPMPLFAVNVEDPNQNLGLTEVNFLENNREYLYSFIGAYQSNYLSEIRIKLLELKSTNSIIELKDDWHFNDVVYRTKQRPEDNLDNFVKTEEVRRYNEVLLNSRFSLCPSGSGPNSIRLWESLAVGSIPVLLADELELPYHPLWGKAILRVAIADYKSIPKLIADIDVHKEKLMRKNCLKIYEDLKSNYANRRAEVYFQNLLRSFIHTVKKLKKKLYSH